MVDGKLIDMVEITIGTRSGWRMATGGLVLNLMINLYQQKQIDYSKSIITPSRN